MANLRDIRKRIESINNTQQITRAMKMVASAKLRKAQERMNNNRPYAANMASMVGRLSSIVSSDNVLLKEAQPPTSALLIVVGSDRGLCGGFNNNLFKMVEPRINDDLAEYKRNDTLSMITIGSKPSIYYSQYNYPIVGKYPAFYDDHNFNKVSQIMGGIIDRFVEGVYDEVYLAYNEFKTVMSQNRVFKKILPIDTEDVLDSEEEEESTTGEMDYIFEPDAHSIMDALLPKHLNVQLWTAILESFAAEQGARMTAMDNATENAKELEGDLRLQYNKARQAAITTEISEIVSGAQALEDN